MVCLHLCSLNKDCYQQCSCHGPQRAYIVKKKRSPTRSEKLKTNPGQPNFFLEEEITCNQITAFQLGLSKHHIFSIIMAKRIMRLVRYLPVLKGTCKTIFVSWQQQPLIIRYQYLIQYSFKVQEPTVKLIKQKTD